MEQYYTLEVSGLDSIIANAVTDFNCLGIEELSLSEEEVDAVLGEKSYCGGNLPIGLSDELERLTSGSSNQYFFNTKEEASFFQKYVNTKYSDAKTYLEINEVKDWNAEWKKHYDIVELLGGKIKIIPDWEKNQSTREEDLIIHPGQGFGTGTHETTQGCLELLYRIENTYGRVFDFGCGSGILGIAAQKWGNVKECVYMDIDDLALENTEQNLKLNNILKNYKILNFTDKEKLIGNFDLVFANILAPVLIDQATFLEELKAQKIILSGLLENQVEEVLSYYPNYIIETKVIKNSWVAILLQRFL